MSQCVELNQTFVDVLDVEKKKIYYNKSLADLLVLFKNEPSEENPNVFVFKSNIKIRDLLGWTTLKEIKIIKKKVYPLVLIHYDKKIITSTSILMPIYDIKETSKFRGFILNRYDTKHYNEFTRNDLLLFSNYNKSKIVYFGKLKRIIPFSKKNRERFLQKFPGQDIKFEFGTLKTSTGTATLNSFHWITNFKEK